MKFEQNWPEAPEKKLFENVNGRTHGRTHGRTDARTELKTFFSRNATRLQNYGRKLSPIQKIALRQKSISE